MDLAELNTEAGERGQGDEAENPADYSTPREMDIFPSGPAF